MYAVMDSGNRQYKVAEGDLLRVERLSAEEGQTLKVDRVLMLVDGSDIKVGRPYLEGASVDLKVVSHGRADKVLVVKMKRRKNYRRTQGHRQQYSELLVESINKGA